MSISSLKKRCYTAYIMAAMVAASYGLGETVFAAEPIVILEYNRTTNSSSGYEGSHPFRMDANYSVRHKVQPNETLSHILANYYGGSGLDFSFVQMAIIKKNKSAFVRQNPNYMFADVNLHLPSVNEIRSMITKSAASEASVTPAHEPHHEIYFFGG